MSKLLSTLTALIGGADRDAARRSAERIIAAGWRPPSQAPHAGVTEAMRLAYTGLWSSRMAGANDLDALKDLLVEYLRERGEVSSSTRTEMQELLDNVARPPAENEALRAVPQAGVTEAAEAEIQRRRRLRLVITAALSAQQGEGE